ncbi:unknown_gene_3334 [Phodopus roborovskii]|uniref:Unknown_gene_3334 protein n=1 Tax=Phodopus roborovskii TaxID=109678 RepID=A0AAU9ZVN5_PHORO|nr:unknown_gene_3334 [Phodopus roborovskii]
MKVMIVMAFLVLTAHSVPVPRSPGKIILCYPFLNSKPSQRLCELLKLCRKPRMNTTSMVPSLPPTTGTDFSLTGSPPAPLTTPHRRGDSR